MSGVISFEMTTCLDVGTMQLVDIFRVLSSNIGNIEVSNKQYLNL